ncbi:MAG: hypothetical protein PSX42_08370 [bacterium]|nr:hypothetical protein [bacterium]
MMAFVLQRPETLFFGSVLCAVYAIFRTKFSPAKWDELFVVSILVLTCLVAVLSFNHGIGPIFYLFSTISVFYAAKNFSKSSIKEISLCLEIVFWLAIFAIGCVLLNYWDSPEPFGEVIPGSSTNGIPSYLIILQIALSLAVFLEKKKLPINSPIFTLMVAIFGLGRGSIVVASIILASSIAINFSLKKMAIEVRFGIMLLVIIIISIFFIFYFDYGIVFYDLVGQTKFSEGLLDPYRVEIFNEYLSKLNYFSGFFGSDYSGTVIATRYDGNPHISYVRTHAYYGFFALLFVIFSPLLILLSNKKFLYKFVFLSFILFALIRALSEPLLFPTLLDFFYFSYFFMFFRYAPSVTMRQ